MVCYLAINCSPSDKFKTKLTAILQLIYINVKQKLDSIEAHGTEALLEIKPLTQKSKDRLLVIGALALEIYFVYGSVSGLYKYLNFGINIELYLGVSSIVIATILLIFLIILLASCLDKRKVLKSFKN